MWAFLLIDFAGDFQVTVVASAKRVHSALAGVVGWCDFQCRGVLLIWIKVGPGPTLFAVAADRGCLDIFPHVYHFFFLSPSLWETADTD